MPLLCSLDTEININLYTGPTDDSVSRKPLFSLRREVKTHLGQMEYFFNMMLFGKYCFIRLFFPETMLSDDSRDCQIPIFMILSLAIVIIYIHALFRILLLLY